MFPRAALALALVLVPACAPDEQLDPLGAGGRDAGTDASAPPDAGPDADADAGRGGGGGAAGAPAWLGDAGELVRAPVATPLHAICGIASNPGDMPLGDDAASAALRAGYFDAANDLGGVMIRRDVRWNEVEPEKGTFVWDRYDELVMEADMQGVRMLATLDYGNPWANADAGDIFWPPNDPEDFATYAAAVASRYPARFTGYEIWNEPNAGFRFWKPTFTGDPAGYGTLLAGAADALRAADPATPVLLGGTVFTPQLIEGAMQWLGEAYTARSDLAKSFDVEGIHTYMQYPPTTAPEVGGLDDAPLEDKIRMHAWLLAQHAAGAAPMWITEIGWPVTSDVDEAAQARYMVRATILAARAGAAAVFWYTLRDGPDPSQFPPEDAFGLLHHDPDPAAGDPPSPKPVYPALKALLAVVGERWPSTDDPASAGLPAGVYVTAFAGTDPGRVYAMWTASGDLTALLAPVAGQVLEQDGSMRGPVKQGDLITISGDVTYLVE